MHRSIKAATNKAWICNGHVIFILWSAHPNSTMNCSRYFQDSHFSDFVDKQTKYTTKCMITAPVMNGKEPIGVVMALNKQGANEFSKSDQEVSEQKFIFNSGGRILP